MNWVAHFVLSNNEKELILGNWLGEVVRGRDYEDYSEGVERGILLHREIDTFTDANPIIKHATKLFHKDQGKFSPVVVDLVFDYYLIKNWKKFRADSYDDFTTEIYQILDENKSLYPENLQNRTEALIHHDWFKMYKTLTGLKEVLRQMSLQTKYPNNMENAIDDVRENDTILNEYFLDFFPELELHCANFLKYYDF